jgi:hypothetical protein
LLRPAKPNDLEGLIALGIEALESDPYPNLVISRDKVREMAVECMSGAQNFCWVCDVDGEVRGAVSAIVHDMMFYERRQATVIQFYCKEPGQGVQLLREFLKWARSRRVIYRS